MKNDVIVFFTKTLIFLFFLTPISDSIAQTGSFKVRDDAIIQIGYNGINKALLFGGNESYSWTHKNGLLGLEYWNNGLNFFTPWPSYGAANYKLFIKRSDGKVGIGKYPSHKLDVNGDIATFGTVRITSDKRLKKNITALNSIQSLTAITALKTYTYQYKFEELPIVHDDKLFENADSIKLKTMEADLKKESNPNTKIRTGFMAQELMEVLPNLVEKDESDRYSIDFMALIPIMTSAIQEQQRMIKTLELKTNSLEKEINELKKK